jgi:hypothetical protein
MKAVSLDAIPVSVPYRLRETSAIIDRGGASDVIVKLVSEHYLPLQGIAATAFRYQTEPQAPFPALPAHEKPEVI